MRPLSTSDLNPAILKVEYAVRGELAIKAEEYRKRLALGGEHGLPFDKVISSNIGNPQQKGLDQPPLTFTRQVSIRLCYRDQQLYSFLRVTHSWFPGQSANTTPRLRR